MARGALLLMSTVKKRPQLSLEELQQLKWLLGGILAIVAAWSMLYVEVDAWMILLITSLAVPVTTLKPAWVARIPARLHRLVFPAVVAIFGFDLYTTGEPLPAMIRLDILLLLYRATNYRKRRDDLQLIVLALFLVVTGGVLSISPLFVAQILVFSGCSLALLFVLTLTETPAAPAVGPAPSTLPAVAPPLRAAPAWTAVNWGQFYRRFSATTDWRIAGFGGLLFAGIVGSSAFLFLAIPRFQLENSLFLDQFLNRRAGSGFSDTIKFGDVSDIRQDGSVAMRVDMSGGRARLPHELYWRMVVLDDYHNRTFRMSNALKAFSFDREVTGLRVNGAAPPRRDPNGYWTFYLEPGAGRYLPIAGAFRQIEFNDTQSFRLSEQLKLVMLSYEPLSMKAYRVEGMTTTDAIEDDDYLHIAAPAAVGPGGSMLTRPTFLDIDVSDSDRAVLDQTVREITGGKRLSAREFAEAAGNWLGRRHAYALRMEMPSGAGDPLVRWLASTQPGHCELFAGAFTLLARAAGFPTRVVAGYLGGDWNEDYLIVRNSDAHAWCEIFDGRKDWIRADPTAMSALVGAAGSVKEGVLSPTIRNAQAGWSSRLDRLRILWYRRVVSFERKDQVELMRSFKRSATDSGDWARRFVLRSAVRAKIWWSRPWTARRLRVLAEIAVVAGGLILGWRYFNRSWRWRLRFFRGASDPVRAEAGRWLQRIALRSAQAPEWEEVRGALERVRYGRSPRAAEAAAVFRQARRMLRSRVRKD
jgi:transglutaminase-like putative cysteine protease